MALGCMLALLGGFRAPGAAEEIAIYRLTDVEGFAATRYFGDEVRTRQGGENGVSRTGQSGYEWRNEVFMMTHGYVYHPNFLILDIGGGPILQQGEQSSEDATAHTSGGLYTLVGRADFLRGKPMSGSLFYEHLNPVLSRAAGQVLKEENSRYGIELSASDAVVPAPIRVALTHSASRGRNDRVVIDDQQDLLNLRLSHTLGSLGETQLQYQASRQDSRSGDTSLAIRPATSEGQSLDVDTRWRFGADGDHEMLNRVSLNEHESRTGAEALQGQKGLNFLLDLRSKLSPEVTGTGSYHYSHDDNSERTAETRNAASGVTWSPRENLELSVGGRAEDQQAGPFSLRNHGLNGSIGYQQGLPLGSLQASYSVRRDQHKQQALAADGKIFGDQVTLAGTGASALALPHVVPGSVVVSNVTRSQVYQEGLDYQLTTVGRTTRLQRLIGGRILDREDVLVDYSHDLGGTFAHEQMDQTLNLNWIMSPQVSSYLREFRSATDVVSGTPAVPLEDTRSTLYGVRADYPVNPGVALTVGGRFERERVADKVSPLRREAVDLYLQTDEPLFNLGNFGLSLRRMTLDYENSTQDLDLQGYSLRFSTRLFGADLSAVRNYERDRGGPVARRQQNDAINLQWRRRKLTVTGSLARQWESQGSFERTETLAQVSLRREF